MTETTQPPRTTYVPEADGTRRVVPGGTVVAAFGDGRELRIEFSRHPSSDGGVMVRSEFVPSGEEPDVDRRGGPLPEVVAAIHILPGGGNVMHVSADARRWPDESEVVKAGAVGAGSALFSVLDGVRTPVGSTAVVMDFGDRSDLTIRFGDAPATAEGAGRRTTPGWARFLAGPQMTLEEYESMKSGGPSSSSSLHLHFGAVNVIHVEVIRQKGVRLPPDWPRPPALGT